MWLHKLCFLMCRRGTIECKLKHIFQEIEMFVCFGGSHGASNISKKLVGFRELWLDEMHYVSTIDG